MSTTGRHAQAHGRRRKGGAKSERLAARRGPEQKRIVLSARDSAAVVEALLDREPAGAGLRRVALRYRTFMSQR